MKTNSENRNRINISKKRGFLFISFSVFLALILALILGELILRTIPIPGIQLDNSKFDPLVGSGSYPHSTLTYRNMRGDFVQRKNNSWGYLDVEHKKEKIKGSYRIGFFGDSYTEAVQVPLENTFFRIIERELENYNVECLAFGNSGLSTLQSYLNYRRWADYFNLDLVIYVFCKNDLGDQIKEIKKSPNIPYAVLTDNGFQIDNSFRERNRFRQRFYFKIGDYLTAHSLVAATLSQRIKLLIKHGIKIKVTKEDRMIATKSEVKSEANRIPNQNDLPSSWPDSWREYATKLGSAVILKWSDEVEGQSRKFAVLYITRSTEMEKETKDQDSWKSWLESLCEKHNITFIDPTAHLIKMKLSGKEIFYDHFTKEGHAAFAGGFVKWFIRNSSKVTEN